MAFQQDFGGPARHFESDDDLRRLQKLNSRSSMSTTTSENVNGCFDCNICLEAAHDPVVTLCGHLYCWPCIYKWLQVQSSSSESDEQPSCPICKSYISTSSLVPLYGRGPSSSDSEAKKPQLDLVIPQRPPAIGMNGVNTLLTAATSMNSQPQNHRYPFRPQSQSFHSQQYFPHPFGNYTSVAPSSFESTTMTTFCNPMINMFGELVFTRIFGGSDTGYFSYPHPNSYPISSVNGSPRLRRQERQLEMSLNRVFIFLFCFLVLCLLLF